MEIPSTPLSLKDPPKPPTPQKTLSRWDQFLGSIAVGTPIQDAMMKHYMTRADIEACVRRAPEERARWNDARLAARKRAWTVFEVEDILKKISGGMPINDAVAEVKGHERCAAETEEFTYLCAVDPELHDQYMRACKSRAIIVGEEILKIADDPKDDTLPGRWGDIPNQAAVNRAKLKVETRTKLMSSWFPKLFSEKNSTQVNVQINNHAARLEEARQRASSRHVTLPEKTVEAVFQDVPQPVQEPVDTAWLEEK